VNFREGMLSALRHDQVEFTAQNSENRFDTSIAECGKSPHVGTSDTNGAGAQGERFENIASTPESAIDEHRDAIAHGLNHFRQTVDRCAATLGGAPAMVGDDDPVGAILNA